MKCDVAGEVESINYSINGLLVNILRISDMENSTKSTEEILSEVTNHKYVSESGPILEFVRQLTREGKLVEVSEFVQSYINKVPKSEYFVLSRLPAIILNSYICGKSQVTYDQFIKWSESDKLWTEEIKDSISSADKFVTTISNILVRVSNSKNSI